MVKIFNDYRDFKKGDLVKMRKMHWHESALGVKTKGLGAAFGIVTGHNKQGWINITWSNSATGSWPYYKIAKVLTSD